MTILATELFAMSQGTQCKGDFTCYWCFAKCTKQFLAPQKAPEWNIKNKHAKCPSSGHICIGCWMFARPSITAIPMDEKDLKDRQTLKRYSLWITSQKTRIIDPSKNATILYESLMSPPLTFCMALLDGQKNENMLQHAYVNQLEKISADTELAFTINNTKYTYTPYELEKALEEPKTAKGAGVSALLKMFGPYPLLRAEKRETIQGPTPSIVVSESKREIRRSNLKKLSHAK